MAVSWKSNPTNHISNFCEGCQVIERGGWPEGVHPIKYSADSNGGDNTQVEQSVASQVDGGDTQLEPSVALQVVVDNTQLEPSVASQVEDPEPILL